MMKIAVALMFVSCAVAAPQVPLPPPPGSARFAPGAFVPILEKSFDITPDGSYSFQYTSADGSSRQESGALRNPGTVAESNAVTGSYSYIADDGTTVTVNYIADENGFQPEGSSINPAITRSVAAQVQEAAAVRSGVVPVPLPGQVRAPIPIPAATVAPFAPVRPILNPAINPAYNPGAYNPAVYNPGAYNPAYYNQGAYNQGAYNPSYYNPSLYPGYTGYRGYSGYRGINPYYNPAFPNRLIPTPTPAADIEASKV